MALRRDSSVRRDSAPRPSSTAGPPSCGSGEMSGKDSPASPLKSFSDTALVAIRTRAAVQPLPGEGLWEPEKTGSRILFDMRPSLGGGRVLEHRFGDHQALDLGGSLADLEQLHVPKVAFRGILTRVPVAAEDLDRLLGHAIGRLR